MKPLGHKLGFEPKHKQHASLSTSSLILGEGLKHKGILWPTHLPTHNLKWQHTCAGHARGVFALNFRGLCSAAPG